MRILFDTNIFIHREDDKVILDNLQHLLQILSKMKAEILIHPLSIQELKKDSNKERKAIVQSKVGSYNLLESPPEPSNDLDFLSKVKQNNDHDRIDNNILYAIYKNAVDFLLTEDKGIHKKAIDIGVNERVLLINDVLDIFKKEITVSKSISPPAVKEDFVYNLNLDDPIFDTLKKDYSEFDSWFENISRKGRKCIVHHRSDNSIGALLIYKFEDEPIAGTPPLPKKKRLKLATLIVSNVGQKIGELFIKLSIDLAIKNRISELYLTHFVELDDRLVYLISEYGFRKVSTNKRGEDIFIKRMIVENQYRTNSSPIDIVREFYPSFYDGENVQKFIVPIQPDYHSRLFTDYPKRQTRIDEHQGEFIIEGNTIKKAYLSHSKILKIQSGDIVLFYRSDDFKQVTSIGVVESIHTRITDPDEIMRIVGKRTVYSRREIEEMAEKPTTIMLFYHIFHLPNPISYGNLKTIGALSGPPQSISGIEDESYREIIKRSGIDERFTIH
ncbi:MAG: hypothetical protein AEth_01483 [Candidatus Argoarchaeum ethanivorans]|uniref:N-acetyltransferase domain-containing protein n=1 Tax=Candidatus Argoarchaeum ethanivorans TaxID=2608793 RepID=A0A8B3S1F4_9EURY|nr:MAG: hypothetical protein AEth_01483 [Candidatus Argoarchaeum ethanivorans]